MTNKLMKKVIYKLLFIHCIDQYSRIYNKIFNNKLLFKRIDKNPFVILQKNKQNMFRLFKIIRNYREEISSIEIKQLITDKIMIKAALSPYILIYTFSLNYHSTTHL